MWIDELKTEYMGEVVAVERHISSFATPDTIWLTFEDGSILNIRVQANIPEGERSEYEAHKIADTQSAVKHYHKIIKKLYGKATEKKLDVDIVGLGLGTMPTPNARQLLHPSRQRKLAKT